MRVFHTFTVNIGGKQPRRELLEGRYHLVVPVGLLPKSGVVHGSKGPILYTEEENVKSIPLWNHLPMVLYHPKENGEFISAKQPMVVNTRKVGMIFNTAMGTNLAAEGWFDEERTKEVDNRVYEAVLNGKQMETSTGLESDVDFTPGEYEGTKYNGVACNHRPDHFAILPDQKGAYSVAKGGGIWANMAGEPEGVITPLDRAIVNALKPLGANFTANELSFNATTRMLSELLASQYGERGKYWDGYVCEVYPSFVIFSDGNGKRYMVSYTASDTGVSLQGQAVLVVPVMTYKTADGKMFVGNESSADPVLQPSQESTTMAFDKNAHLTALIGNGYDEKDREWLSKLPDDQLGKIKPVTQVTANTTAVSPPPVPPVTPPATGNKQLTVNEWLNDAAVPLEVRQTVQRTLARDEAHKKVLIEKLVANTKFKAEFLKDKTVEELEGWASAFQTQQQATDLTANASMFQDGYQPPYYGGAAGAPPIVNQGDLETPIEEMELAFDSPYSKK